MPIPAQISRIVGENRAAHHNQRCISEYAEEHRIPSASIPPPFYKPFANLLVPVFGTVLKKQVPLLSADHDRIPVALATGLRRRGRLYLQHAVDFVLMAVFPFDDAGKHGPVSGEVDLHLDVFLLVLGSLAIAIASEKRVQKTKLNGIPVQGMLLMLSLYFFFSL